MLQAASTSLKSVSSTHSTAPILAGVPSSILRPTVLLPQSHPFLFLWFPTEQGPFLEPVLVTLETVPFCALHRLPPGLWLPWEF